MVYKKRVMRKIVFFLVFVAFGLSAFSQQAKSSENRLAHDDLMMKSKRQNRIAKGLLITGAVLVLTSIVIPKGELVRRGLICGPGSGMLCNEKYKNDGVKTGFFAAGVVSVLGSVPFFISAKKNRRRATTIALGWEDINEHSPFLADGSFPVIQVNIRF
jgi:hypothetical protein